MIQSAFIAKVFKLYKQDLSASEILEQMNLEYNKKGKSGIKIYPDNVNSAIRLIKMGVYKNG